MLILLGFLLDRNKNLKKSGGKGKGCAAGSSHQSNDFLIVIFSPRKRTKLKAGSHQSNDFKIVFLPPQKKNKATKCWP